MVNSIVIIHAHCINQLQDLNFHYLLKLTQTIAGEIAMLPTRRIPIILLALVLFMMTSVVAHASDSEQDDVIKVVYHADYSDPRRFSAMLTSINNMVTYYQNEFIDYDVRIVFVAHGIRFLTDDKLEKTPFAEDKAMAERRESNKGRLLSLNTVQNVKLELCDITRSQIGLDASKLYQGVESIPSGVVRIAELQRQGFAYIKIE
jgi:intracellular sulfur oxidation DsrE/DsrF family protein